MSNPGQAASNITATGQAQELPYLMELIGDTISTNCALFFAVVEEKRIDTETHGGEEIRFPVRASVAGNGKWIDSSETGDTITVAPSNTMRRGVVHWRENEEPLSLPRIQVVLANTPEQKINAKAYEIERGLREATDRLGTAIWIGGYEADTGPTVRPSIEGIVAWLGNVNVRRYIAGFDRDANQDPFFANANVAGSTITQISITLYNKYLLACKKRATRDFLGATTANQFQKLWAEGKNHVSLVQSGLGKKLMDFNFPTIEINGCPVIADAHAPADLSLAVGSGGIGLANGAEALAIIHLGSWKYHTPPSVAGTRNAEAPKMTSDTSVAWRGFEFEDIKPSEAAPRHVGHLYSTSQTTYSDPNTGALFPYLAAG